MGISQYMLELVSKSRLLSHLYYSIFSNSFWNEQHNVLNGRIRYLENTKGNNGNKYLLRRNIHRLEKGLITRPRKSIFATEYILETIITYSKMIDTSNNSKNLIDMGEIKWAHDVIKNYFEEMTEHPDIELARKKFESIDNPAPNSSDEFTPYVRKLGSRPPVDYQQLHDLACQRRSVRYFTSEPVPHYLIDQALMIANQSPSACNRQPYEFLFFDEPDMVNKIIKIPYGMGGFGQNVPLITVLIGKQRSIFHDGDRHLIYIDGSLACMCFLLALETLGLSSCCINLPDISTIVTEINELLNLELDEKPIMLIAIGFPDPNGLITRSKKKSLHKIRKFNPK